MDIQTIILILVGTILLVVNLFLFLHTIKTNKNIDNLLEKGKIKDFKEILLSQKSKNEEISKQIKEAFLRIEELEKISEITIRKTGIVRFNPFNDMGGNQSFVVALLDNKNNGFIISSLFIKEGSRVYTKTIRQGKSDYSLSNEEQEAINRAIKSHG